ncbi:hypothetical protein I350_01763 [Cryptococcus amylolentus CBS 6273]|uniref:Integral membrane bound transporter domain-containing protein n=1 Tax=Cryptococcus amylolentus CBS 6273 TaxID=1296118 RepID=A0A1E3KDH9_9TREE|nr:hypothetical protein I350_01763 [Cryptococcus amylolentus CBS 6273]
MVGTSTPNLGYFGSDGIPRPILRHRPSSLIHAQPQSRSSSIASARSIPRRRTSSASLTSIDTVLSTIAEPARLLQRRDNWQSLQEVAGDKDDEDEEDEDEDEGGGGGLGKSHVSIRRLSVLPSVGAKSVRGLFGHQASPSPLRATFGKRDPSLTRSGSSILDGGDLTLSPKSTTPRQLEDGPDDGGIFDSGQLSPKSTGKSPFRAQTAEEDLPFSENVPKPAPDPKPSKRLKNPGLWPPSLVTISVFKCAVAYFIASLFTFVPALSRLLSRESMTDIHGRVTWKPADQAHMVATIVVYFNPAKTLGNMFLSTRYCIVLTFITSIASLFCMGTVLLFDHFSPSHGHSWDLVSEMGDWVMCVVWIGGTLGLLAWGKLYVGNPSWNGGCSMAAMLLYNVVIRDGALPKLAETLEIIAIGVCITNLVNYTVFPLSATSRLQSSISKTLSSFSTLLDILTSTFLLEKTIIKEDRTSIKDAIKAHAVSFKTLKSDLSEARHESAVDERIRGKKLRLYEAAVASLGRLAQHLGGLRSCTRLQESLIRASKEGKVSWDFDTQTNIDSPIFSISALPPVDGPRKESVREDDVETSVRLFLEFRKSAGAQMISLNDCCDEALETVAALSRSDPTQVNLSAVRTKLADTLRSFRFITSRAIKEVYAGPVEDDDEAKEKEKGREEGQRSGSDLSQLADGPNETVFWIYFFLFTYEEFAREIIFLLDTMQELAVSHTPSIWDHIKHVFGRKRGRKEGRGDYIYKQLQNLVPIDPSKLQPPLCPGNSRDATSASSNATPKRAPLFERMKRAWWYFGERLAEPDMRYAIRTGLGGAMLALPAYTHMGRDYFLEYRGEWALIAYLAAMSQTVGQTNYLSLARIFGTIIGGTCAVIFTKLFPENPIMLPICGFFISMPCFYIITQLPAYNNAGRFILLTYNLSCLYEYNSRGEVSVELIAFRRSTSVIAGVIWAGIVSRYWWPFTARQDFCLDLSYLYSKLVTTYSKGVDTEGDNLGDDSSDDSDDEGDVGETTPLSAPWSVGHQHLSSSVRQFMAMELHLQSQLDYLRGLLAQTKNEPRLKGPFAYGFYHEVLLSCERVLDRLHSMRCVTTRDEWNDDMRQAFIFPVNKERREMAGNVILYFYTLSAGLRLRTPVPPYLPPAEDARKRLVNAIRGLEVVKRRKLKSGGRHLLFFAYALAMQEVIAELDFLGKMLQDAYGVISHPTVGSFEDLFVSPKGKGRNRRRRGYERGNSRYGSLSHDA